DGAEQDSLGQRRAFVRSVRFGADKDDVAGVPLVAQLFGGVRAGQAGADDDGVHEVLRVRSRNSARLRGSSRISPNRAEVVVRDPGARAPRKVMHVCSASITTPTPRG